VPETPNQEDSPTEIVVDIAKIKVVESGRDVEKTQTGDLWLTDRRVQRPKTGSI